MVISLRSREKKRVIEQLLSGDHLLLHLVPQVKNVKLPDRLMSNLTVTLKISRKFRGALILHNTEIEAHLLFSESYSECRIPYDAIWGVTDSNGQTTSWLDGFDGYGSTSTNPALPRSLQEDQKSMSEQDQSIDQTTVAEVAKDLNPSSTATIESRSLEADSPKQDAAIDFSSDDTNKNAPEEKATIPITDKKPSRPKLVRIK
jgi:stringent starvation protein B